MRAQLNRIEHEKNRLKQQMDDSRYEDDIRERRKKRSGKNFSIFVLSMVQCGNIDKIIEYAFKEEGVVQQSDL